MILISTIYSYIIYFADIGVAIITEHPISVVQYENTSVTLSCEAIASGPIRYQWERVNREISSDRSEGVNTSTLTISPVQQEDEDEYYCVASYGVMNGTNHSDISHIANVIVYGKELRQQNIQNLMKYYIYRSSNAATS